MQKTNSNPDKAPQPSRSESTNSGQNKTYHQPKLTRHGHVAILTLGAGSGDDDDGPLTGAGIRG